MCMKNWLAKVHIVELRSHFEIMIKWDRLSVKSTMFSPKVSVVNRLILLSKVILL